MSINIIGWDGFLSFHCIICSGYYEHRPTIFFIDILQWGYYEHHEHNRLKQNAHITPVEGGGNKPNGGPENAKSLYYRPFSC